jgi:hypothetical protein
VRAKGLGGVSFLRMEMEMGMEIGVELKAFGAAHPCWGGGGWRACERREWRGEGGGDKAGNTGEGMYWGNLQATLMWPTE